MNEPPELVRLVGSWMEKAREHLRVASLLVEQEGEWPLPAACFHAHQSAETAMKAMLTAFQVPFPKTHDLVELMALLPAAARLRLEKGEAAMLSRFSVRTRYPDPHPITRPQTRMAVALAGVVLEQAAEHLRARMT